MAKHVTIGVGLCVFEAVFSIHVNPIVKYDAGLGLLLSLIHISEPTRPY